MRGAGLRRGFSQGRGGAAPAISWRQGVAEGLSHFTFTDNSSHVGGSLHSETAKITPFPVRGWRGVKRFRCKGGRLSQWLGRRSFREHTAGAIQEIEIEEGLTGQRFSVWLGEYYVRLCVDGQDYYFDRVTGQLDGIGATPERSSRITSRASHHMFARALFWVPIRRIALATAAPRYCRRVPHARQTGLSCSARIHNETMDRSRVPRTCDHPVSVRTGCDRSFFSAHRERRQPDL